MLFPFKAVLYFYYRRKSGGSQEGLHFSRCNSAPDFRIGCEVHAILWEPGDNAGIALRTGCADGNFDLPSVRFRPQYAFAFFQNS